MLFRTQRHRRSPDSHRWRFAPALLLAFACSSVPGWAQSMWNPLAERQPVYASPASEIGATINAFIRQAPAARHLFEGAHAYAVFPDVGMLGRGFVSAYGEGEVYVDGQHVGSARLTQLAAGQPLSDQRYSEIVFFQHAGALNEFTRDGVTLPSLMDAVAVNVESVNGVRFRNGIAVLTLAKGSEHYAAQVSGQQLYYTPKPR
jgi:hypothetical protein